MKMQILEKKHQFKVCPQCHTHFIWNKEEDLRQASRGKNIRGREYKLLFVRCPACDKRLQIGQVIEQTKETGLVKWRG